MLLIVKYFLVWTVVKVFFLHIYLEQNLLKIYQYLTDIPDCSEIIDTV
jgi:hypothetical protein